MHIESLGISGGIKVSGDQPGAKLVVFGSIHGDEPCGAMAIQRFLFDLQSHKIKYIAGETIFVIANEAALAQNKRYIVKNLNRVFHEQVSAESGYEFERVEELKPLLIDNDFFLDIHSTSQNTAPFLFAEKNTLAWAKRLKVPNIVQGWNELSDIDLGGDAESYGNQHTTISLTVECGQHMNVNTWECAYQVLLSFLAVHGAIEYVDQKKSDVQPQIYTLQSAVKLTGTKFLYTVNPENFSFLAKGTIIGKDSEKVYIAPHDCFLIMPGNPERTAIGEELYFLGEMLE